MKLMCCLDMWGHFKKKKVQREENVRQPRHNFICLFSFSWRHSASFFSPALYFRTVSCFGRSYGGASCDAPAFS